MDKYTAAGGCRIVGDSALNHCEFAVAAYIHAAAALVCRIVGDIAAVHFKGAPHIHAAALTYRTAGDIAAALTYRTAGDIAAALTYCVARDIAAVHFKGTVVFNIYTAAPGRSFIAGDGAAFHCESTAVYIYAAAVVCRIAGNSAALHGEFTAINLHAAAIGCIAADDNAARYRAVGARLRIGYGPKPVGAFGIVVRAVAAVTVAQRKVCVVANSYYRAAAVAVQNIAV